MAGVTTEKRGNKWRYRFDGATQDGKRTRISEGGFDTKKEAVAAGTKALMAYNKSGVVFRPSDIFFSDFIDQWMKEYCIPNLKPETILQYEKKIRNHIKPALGKYKLKAVTASILQSLLNKIFQEGYSRNTLVSIKGILSGCLGYAVEPLKYLEYSPMVYVKLPSARAKPEKPTRSSPHVFIPPAQMNMILERFPEETSAHIPIQFGYRCGMRIGEAFAVLWEDIDFENKKLSINRQMQWDAKEHSWYFTDPKYESFRTITIDDTLIALLKRELERQTIARQLMGSRYKRQFMDERKYINGAGNGQGIRLVTVRMDGSLIAPRIMQHASSIIHYKLKFPEFDFHSLRHTHTTMLLDGGAPIKYVQLRLGHKKPDVTIRVYQHETEVSEKQGNDILGNVYNIHEDE